jgi:protein ImuA
MNALPKNIESIHPAVWRAAHLARTYGKTVDTGYAALSEQLPGQGWPVGTVVEFLLQQAGVGELRLLGPALVTVSQKRSVALVAPHQVPNGLGYAHIGVDPTKLMWLKASKSSDALWCAEQILRSGSCGAVMLWQQHIRAESLRRLLLAAQTSETLFVVMRPLACAQDPSPASLRLTVRPAADGIAIEVIKRKGPASAQSLNVQLSPSPRLISTLRRAPRPAIEMPVSAVERANVGHGVSGHA